MDLNETFHRSMSSPLDITALSVDYSVKLSPLIEVILNVSTKIE